MTRKVLVVDDDRKLVDLLRLYLEKDGYAVLAAYDGRQALELSRRKAPDLVVLDLMLPAVDGLDLCRILRAESQVPIIMLTARTTEEDRLRGLDLGADDYVSKPFSPRELVARVRAVLRRAGAAAPDGPAELRFGDPAAGAGQALAIHLLRHEVRVGGALVRLTPKEFKLLETLAREPGRVFSRLDLLEKVFGYDYEGLERTVDVHVMNLRKKLAPPGVDPAPNYIETVFGVGYKFTENPDAG